VIAFLLAAMTLAVLAAIFGSPVGSHNAAVIFVWIVWWGLLKLAFIPLGGRAWCAICPLPAPGEWAQRRAVASRGPARLLGLGREWPRRLRSGWLAVGLLLAIGVASGPILTRPTLTAALLVALAAMALALSTIYRGRSFCRYLCPVGSFVGLYSLAAPVSLRVKDADVCLRHASKECLRGSDRAYGCPWYAYPGSISRNVDCGLCFECLRACPKDNVALYLRAPGADFLPADGTRGRELWPRLDEGYGAVVMLALAAIYSAVFLGPWGALKHEALLPDLAEAARHAALVVGGAGVVAPLAWLGVALVARLAARADVSPRRIWGATAYALVPLGLAAWAAFTVTFVLGSGTYVAGAVADPLGWGWNLLGLSTAWRPLLPDVRLWLPVALWLGGLAWSVAVGRRTLRRLYVRPAGARRATAVIAVALTLCTGGLVWLGLG
ncbi:MAG TPA: 4Fe-4S binding protein, partial [Solirubrobacterales bacterium]